MWYFRSLLFSATVPWRNECAAMRIAEYGYELVFIFASSFNLITAQDPDYFLV